MYIPTILFACPNLCIWKLSWALYIWLIAGLWVYKNIFVIIWVAYIQEPSLGAVTSLYILCCILRIVKIKDLANIVVAALLCHPEMIPESSEAKINGNLLSHASSDVASQNKDANNQNSLSDTENHILHSGLNHMYGGIRFAPRYSILYLTYSFICFFIFSLKHSWNTLLSCFLWKYYFLYRLLIPYQSTVES